MSDDEVLPGDNPNDHFFDKPMWTCTKCSAPNHHSVGFCTSCGADAQ